MNLRSIVVALCLAASAAAQSAGFQDFSFANATGTGSSTISSRVYYPSTSSGTNAPLLAQLGGYPVVVFIHGQGLIGSDYDLFGDQLGSEGYVAVLPNTGKFAGGVVRSDAIALVSVLQTVNSTAGHFLEGALDMSRAGLAGHSVGGNSTVTVLASNPGYRAGLSFAPAYQGGAAAQVDVPLGVIHGTGDNVTPWQTTALRVFNQATSYTGVKFIYLFNGAGDHRNVVGLETGPIDLEVWARAATVTTGFFDRYLKGDCAGLAEVVGTSARSEPRLSDLYVEVEQPELWTVGAPVIGQTMRLELLAEQGDAGVMTAATTGSLNTRFGLLQLDFATLNTIFRGVPDADRLVTWDVPIPTSFAPGDVIPIQGFGLDNLGKFRLTGLHSIVLE